MFLLSTNNTYLIEFVIIPLLDDLTWHTKNIWILAIEKQYSILKN